MTSQRLLKSLVIHEVYASIQGESSFVGLPCTFVRLSACNLRCRWCDTPQAFTGGQRIPLPDLLERIATFGTPLVLVTGGEPLLQPDTPALLTALCDSGYRVLLETSGERDIAGLDPRVHRIVDFKAPGSGEHARNLLSNITALTDADEVKLVLADEADYDWARTFIAEHHLDRRVRHVLLSPVHGELDPQALVRWVLRDRLPVRVQVQVHKYIWGAETQGV